MPIRNPPNFDSIKKAIKNLPVQLGAEAESFFRSNFDVQGWQGNSGVEKWEKRKFDNSSRSVLVGKGSGHLRKGLRKFVNGNNIGVKVTGIATKYADLHNFGGTVVIHITTKMRKYFWAMFYKTGREHWKHMAITRHTTIAIHMPKRQFIGNSRMLDDKLYALIEKKLQAAVQGG